MRLSAITLAASSPLPPPQASYAIISKSRSESRTTPSAIPRIQRPQAPWPIPTRSRIVPSSAIAMPPTPACPPATSALRTSRRAAPFAPARAPPAVPVRTFNGDTRLRSGVFVPCAAPPHALPLRQHRRVSVRRELMGALETSAIPRDEMQDDSGWRMCGGCGNSGSGAAYGRAGGGGSRWFCEWGAAVWLSEG